MAASKQLPDKTRALLDDLWQRNLPVVEARLAVLDRAAQADPLPEELRLDAISVAHKLAGSLGMFGFAEGTRISRQLELALDLPVADSAQLTQLAQQLREELFPAPPASTP